MTHWSDLSNEQRCVLFGAAEHALLFELLALWDPEALDEALLVHVPRLATAIVRSVEMELVEVLQHASIGAEVAVVLLEDLSELLSDQRNWGGEEAPGSILELVLCEKGATVIREARNPYDFRQWRTPKVGMS